MMSKQGNVKGGSTPAAVPWFRRSRYDKTSTPSPEEFAARARWLLHTAHLEGCHRVKRIWRNLTLVLRRVSRPTPVEIDADEYDGSVPISQWLVRESRKGDSSKSSRSVEMSALTGKAMLYWSHRNGVALAH